MWSTGLGQNVSSDRSSCHQFAIKQTERAVKHQTFNFQRARYLNENSKAICSDQMMEGNYMLSGVYFKADKSSRYTRDSLAKTKLQPSFQVQMLIISLSVKIMKNLFNFLQTEKCAV